MGMFSIAGSFLNDITGATSAGAQSQKYALQAAKVNNKYQKEFAQNAHQWEMKDLEKAGLNPVLSAGGGGADAGGSGGVNSGAQAGSGIDPFSTAIGAWQGIENAQRTGAETNQLNAQALNTDQDTLLKKAQTLLTMRQSAKTEREKALIDNQIEKAFYDIQNAQLQRGLISAQTEKEFEQAKLAKRTTTEKGANVKLGPAGEFGITTKSN